MNFWGHVEVLRWVLIRCLVVVFGLAVAVFCLKDFVFDGIILAPSRADFVTYRLMSRLGELTGISGLRPQFGDIGMININLAAQLMTHLRVSFYLAAIVAMPYIIMEIWLFVKPALYRHEQRPARFAIVAFFFQFFLGLMLAYYIIFPVTFNFLANYQVSESIGEPNFAEFLHRHIPWADADNGFGFEMPIVAYFFAKIGVLKSSFLKRYRKVAFVVVLVLAAFITPSTDVFTMSIVALPLYLLYEFSRIVVSRVERGQANQIA